MATYTLLIQSQKNKRHYAIVSMVEEKGHVLDTMTWDCVTPHAIGESGEGQWGYERRTAEASLWEYRRTMLILNGWGPSKPYVGKSGKGFHLKSGKRVPYGEVWWTIQSIYTP